MADDDVELKSLDALASGHDNNAASLKQNRHKLNKQRIWIAGAFGFGMLIGLMIASKIFSEPCSVQTQQDYQVGGTGTGLPKWQGPSTDNWQGQSNDDWRGHTVLEGGKGFAGTPMGLVIYRDIGPRDSRHPIVLLHQSGSTMVQFAEVQNELAAKGFRAITVDTPGSGLSDLPPQQPTIPEFADNLIYVVNHLGLDKFVVAGHHTGAKIAASFAARHSSRVSGVLLHTLTLRTAEEIDSFEASASMQDSASHSRSRTPVDDGSHLSRTFMSASPSSSPEYLAALTRFVVSKYQEGPSLGAYAALRHVSHPDLMAIRARGMLLYDLADSYANVLRAHEARPDFEWVEFTNASVQGAPFSIETFPQLWVTIAAGFLRTLGS